MQSLFSITQLNYIWNKASLTDKMIVVYVTMRHVYMCLQVCYMAEVT